MEYKISQSFQMIITRSMLWRRVILIWKYATEESSETDQK